DMVHVYQMAEEGIIEYDYDSVGNRTEKKRTLDSGTEEIKYYYDSGYGKGNGRRLLYETAIGVDGVERNLYGYSYDENGNLVEKSNRFTVKATGDVELITSGVGVEYWEYDYDVQNQLVKVEKNRDVIAEYGYDVDGMRVLSKINDKRTRYMYNFAGNIVYEEEDGDAKSYIYGHGKIIAEVKGTAGSIGEVYYYHHDNLGSTRLITDSSGQVVMDQDYLPFGDDLNRPSVLKNESIYETGYKYTGQHQEVEIGLYYYGARFYDQRVGRFVSEDSYLGEINKPQTHLLYVYVMNNALRYIDPSGHASVDKSKSNNDLMYITVDHGDTLSQISLDYCGSVEWINLIATFNKITNVDKIYAGNQIKVPNMTLYIRNTHINNTMLDQKSSNLEKMFNYIVSEVRKPIDDLFTDEKLLNDAELDQQYQEFNPENNMFAEGFYLDQESILNDKGFGKEIEVGLLRLGKYSKNKRFMSYLALFSAESGTSNLGGLVSSGFNVNAVKMHFEVFSSVPFIKYDIKFSADVYAFGGGVARGIDRWGYGNGFWGYEFDYNLIPKE
ncbi:MAG: LysM peptidoglycan-binding domain-containing protein, partial [Halanaerobiales bacterium]|nr:LysM peptidoglycan-binding domain-containing protein [Halanaerobiales bacterium]